MIVFPCLLLLLAVPSAVLVQQEIIWADVGGSRDHYLGERSAVTVEGVEVMIG